MCISLRVTSTATITSTNVQVSIRTKSKLPPVVIAIIWVVKEDDHLFAEWISFIGLTKFEVEARGLVIAIQAGIVNVEVALTGIVRWEGDTQQATLARSWEEHPIVDIKEGCGEYNIIFNDTDDATLFDNEQSLTTISGVGEVNR